MKLLLTLFIFIISSNGYVYNNYHHPEGKKKLNSPNFIAFVIGLNVDGIQIFENIWRKVWPELKIIRVLGRIAKKRGLGITLSQIHALELARNISKTLSTKTTRTTTDNNNNNNNERNDIFLIFEDHAQPFECNYYGTSIIYFIILYYIVLYCIFIVKKINPFFYFNLCYIILILILILILIILISQDQVEFANHH